MDSFVTPKCVCLTQMSNLPNENNGNVDGSGGEWRQLQQHMHGPHDTQNVQPPPPLVRDTLPLPPPLPQQHPHVPAYHNQAMLRQQALSPVSLNQPQQHQNVRTASYSASGFLGNIGVNHQGNFSSALNVNPSNNMQDVAGVEGDIVLDPEEQLGGDGDALASNTFQTSVSGWSEVDASGGGIPPSARSLHSAALLNGAMYVFGGYDGNQRVNSFHAYSFTEKRWSPVLPSATSRPPPSPRDRHASVAHRNAFYVHGGFDGTSRDASLFAFDFSIMEWREVLATQGRPPSARHSHAAVVHRNCIYIFGGYDGSYKSDLHEFDLLTSRWNAVPVVGRRPRARYRTTCTVHDNWMILYGGHDGTRHLSDTFLFDFDSKTWFSLHTDGIPPAPRDSHVSVVHGNSMFVFGGSSGRAMNDFYELQLPTDLTTPARWRSINSSIADQPHHRFCHVGVAYNDALYIFGGYDGSERLNSFIAFDFALYDLSFDVPPSTIISDLQGLVNNDTFSDVAFVVDGRQVFAHKLILMRCSYFEALFLGQMREAQMKTIKIDEIRYDTFLSILEYLYTDQLVFGFHNAMELFEAADRFCIHRLKSMCEKRMLECITVDNAAGILHAADIHSAGALRQKAKKYILSHWDEVSKSNSFEEMGRSNIELVFELLKSQ